MNLRTLAPSELAELAVSGGRGAVGRLLSLVERAGHESDLIAELTHSRSQGAYVVGITGAPGAGKSTLVAKTVEAMNAGDDRPAVIAIDPSSPLTGGAILGDRVRMASIDDAAFIRSLANRGHSGGLALALGGGRRLRGK